MFDVGFWELVFIAVIALLVVGPERLPRLARTMGLWLGQLRGYVASVKQDIDRQMEAEDLKAVPDLQEFIHGGGKQPQDSPAQPLTAETDVRPPSGENPGSAGSRMPDDQQK